MMYLFAADQPTMMVMLTEQDVVTMRPGRTVYLDLAQQGIKAFNVSKLMLSLHKNTEAIKDMIRQAGHGNKLKDVVPAPFAESDEETCAGCGGVNKKFNLYLGQCIVCWYKKAMTNLRDSN